jgi:5-methylcytosine-specific restriction endonuclease McrA
MPKRMSEKDRVRGSNRVRILIADIRYHGKLLCPYCQQEITDSPHIDHIVARRNGGKVKEFDNLITCCASCNGRKCDTDVKGIFGKDIDELVNKQINGRALTETDKQASIDIFYSAKKWNDRLELILDWIELGLLPIR